MIPLIIILLNLSGGSNAGEVRNNECGVKKSEMGTDQSTNPSPAHKISPAEMWVRLLDEGQPWREPPILKGNSAIDRLRHDPE